MFSVIHDGIVNDDNNNNIDIDIEGYKKYLKQKQHKKEYFQRYYIEKMKGFYVCEICNKSIDLTHKARHNKTIRHLNNLNNKEN